MVTNDFPPRAGGIQSYLHALAGQLCADLVVYAPSWPGHRTFDPTQPFPVVRHPGRLILPTPRVRRRVADVARAEHCEAVWFGAAAPLALLASRLAASRFVASTHGHEVGWSMTPGARQAMRRIGATTDVLTFVSRFTRSRISAALGPHAVLEHLPAGVDTRRFRPDPASREEVRRRYGLSDRPVLLCVSRLVRRKGQHELVRALPAIRARVPGATLLLVGDGPERTRLRRSAGDGVVFTGAVPTKELPAFYAAGDVFAMPCRTRGCGLDVEGLGMVCLEAAASGLPVLTGRSGGAPETVRDGVTGHVVGADLAEVAAALLADPATAKRMGAAGREWMRTSWRWEDSAARLADLIGD